MAKLTKQETAFHNKACDYLQKDVLTHDERLFVLEHWQESANHINSASGAFFTPFPLAQDLSIEAFGTNVLDLCAGIGSIAFALYHRYPLSRNKPPEITCVEMNPDYVAIGRKVLPEATWLVADVLDLPESITGFDCAIANPPFGRIKQPRNAPRYTSSEFEYKVIDIASDRADYGVFLVPQPSAPFRFSGQRCYEEVLPDKYKRFSEETLIELEPNCGIDTTVGGKNWRGVSILTEVVLADFKEIRARRQAIRDQREQSGLFASASADESKPSASALISHLDPGDASYSPARNNDPQMSFWS